MSPSPEIYRDAQLVIRRSLEPDGLVIEGELDSWNADAVANALSGISLGPGGDFQVNLTDLQFCDVSGIRVIVGAANNLGEKRRLVLLGLAPRLRRVLDIVGWGASPGLMIGPKDGGAPEAI